MVKAPKLEYGPKKPLTAYILFMVDSREDIKKKNKKASSTEIVSLIGQKWRGLSDSEKARFEEGAVADKVRPAAVRARDPTATHAVGSQRPVFAPGS
jgi:structure-specific recognition protein 1